MKQKIKQTKWYHLLLMTVLAAVLVFSCRKLDSKSDILTDAEIESKFFNKNRSSEIVESKIVNFLQNKNNKHNFINKTVERIGYPAWNKMIKVGNETGANFKGNTNDDSIVVAFIPFVRESQNVVNACLKIKMSPSDTSYSYICDWQYHDSASVGLSARKQSLLLMQLNKNVFGSVLYKITDSAAFGVNSANKAVKYVKLQSSNQQITGGKVNSTNKTNLVLMVFTICDVILVPKHEGQLTGCEPGDPNCNDYVEELDCQNYYIWASEGGGGDSGGNEGGVGTGDNSGGGGGDDGTPPPCNGVNAGRTSNVTNPCTPGWEPVEDDTNVTNADPCDEYKKKARKLDTMYTKGKVDSLLNTIPNLAAQTKEHGFPLIQKISINPYNVHDTTFGDFDIRSTIFVGTDSTISYNFNTNNLQMVVGGVHTHPSGGYPAHSAHDIYEMIRVSIVGNQYNQGSFVAAFNGTKYAITFSNFNQALAFWNTKPLYLNGAKWNEDSDIGKSFESAKKYFRDKYDGNPNQEYLAYEMAMAAVLSKFNTGITLNKQDASGNFKPIIVTQVTDPKKHKRIIYSQECL